MWTNKRVVILGLARQGYSLARYLVAQGARVTASDMKSDQELETEIAVLHDLPIRYLLGSHPFNLLNECDTLFLSGGVPIDLPIVLEAKRRRIPISNDTQVFLDACSAPVIGITGSAGKTTTTTLAGEILKHELSTQRSPGHVPALLRAESAPSDPNAGSDRQVWVGGNIGNPLLGDLDRITQQDYVIVEISSFQLELMTRSPHIACITNITPNHLDRHGTMESYIAAKRRIVDFQTAADWDVLCFDDEITRTMIQTPAKTLWFSVKSEPQGDGAWLDTYGDLRLRLGEGVSNGVICHIRDLILMGEHNVLNILAACAITGVAGASVDSMRAVATSFKGVEHRLQLVRTVNDVQYYDDSIATTPERLTAALRCFAQPVILLCGGRDKHLPWSQAVQLMAKHCQHVFLFGEMASMVAQHVHESKLQIPTTMCGPLEEALKAAAASAQPGDVVLLSPGGTSFDAYKDFAERGDRYVQLIDQILQAGGDETQYGNDKPSS